jgi:nascent polypeptide-associated complex subunit alpha
MIPGGRMNPRQMKQAMKRLGIKAEEIEEATEVIIRTPTEEYVISNPSVTRMEVQGQITFQVLGDCELRERTSDEKGLTIHDKDITLVMEQTGCSKEEAVKALQDTDGQPAEAILQIVSS